MDNQVDNEENNLNSQSFSNIISPQNVKADLMTENESNQIIKEIVNSNIVYKL